MTDTMTPEQRHRCMSHIRSKATKPELLVRQWLWSHGYRYRLNVTSVPGKPDIVLRPYRTAIFVNGCFWHGHGVRMSKCGNALMRECGNALMRECGNALMRECGNALMCECGNVLMCECVENSTCCKIPQTNREFWVEKIRRNQERDQRNYALLQAGGWQVIVVWECQLKPDKIEHTMCNVQVLLEKNILSQYKKHIPIPYPHEEESALPTAAEDGTTYGQ